MDLFRTTNRKTFLLSLMVFAVTFLVYLATIAPSVTFWDCGELIAASYTLGIPHPPGSPLYVLIARLFSLLPLGDQVAFRINLASAFFASLTALIGFLTIVKLSCRLKLPGRIGHTGGIVGSFCLAFSNTFWSNATESEVYSLSMLLMLLLFYLTLWWMDESESKKGDRLLVLIAYLGLLSTAVHMTSYLVMPVVFLLVIWYDKEKLRDFRVWVTGILFSLVMLVPTVPTEALLVGLVIWLVVTFVASLNSRTAVLWALPLALTVAATAGYSSQLYIPIRSSLDPVIDENDPDTWPKFKRFLERRQYGETGMVERSFSRRGRLANQIGTQERIGFWRFFREQYSSPKLWFVPVFTGLFGIVMLVGHRPREGLSLFLVLLLATLGLVWYMNFGDGTVPGQRLEVRDRDYFFLPGFVLFALFIGLGAATLSAWIVARLETSADRKTRFLASTSGIIFVILPVLSLAGNYQRNDRSGNWVAYDFAYNLLNTCDQNALLFTNGDNDTFPLWFMQKVEGVRQDVRVLNFSLINIDWYIRQQKGKFNVPITLSEGQIQSLRSLVYEGRHYRIQDQMLDHILDVNAWKYPVIFSNTVPPENRIYKGRSLDNHLILLGLAGRLVPEEGFQMVDLEGLRNNLYQVYRYRTPLDSQPKLDETSRRMLSYDLSCFFSLADTLGRAGQFEEAVKVIHDGKTFAPQDWRVYAMLVQLYVKAGRTAEAEQVIQEAPKSVEKERLYYNLGYTFKTLGQETEYERYMQNILRLNAGFKEAYQELFASYYNQKRRLDLLELLKNWTSHNPQDRQAYSLLQAVQNPNFNFPDSAAIRQAIGQ